MPNILPISDLRNYNRVLSKVDVDKPVYLTRNGRGKYVITKIDDYSREETAESLLKEIQKGEKSLTQKKGIALEQLAKKYNLSL